MNSLKKDKITEHRLTRRNLIKAGILVAMTGMLPKKGFANLSEQNREERSLSLYNIHTDEYFKGVYWADGEYIPDAITKIDFFLRDYRRDEVTSMDTQLLDLMHTLQTKLETKKPIRIISGYRSPETNAMLHKKSHRVAINSLHIQGKAIDLSIPSIPLVTIKQTAVELQGGGVGYYPRSGFVHIDTGRIRYW